MLYPHNGVLKEWGKSLQTDVVEFLGHIVKPKKKKKRKSAYKMTPSYKKKGNMKIYLCLLIHSKRNTQIKPETTEFGYHKEEEKMGK